MDVLQRIAELRIVPVVKITTADAAVPLAQALCRGGLPCAEVTFRSAAAAESIARMRAAFPEMLVGAGTVLTPQQVDDALNAGATFIVSPGLNPRVVEYCQKRGALIIPGCATPSDVERALELGLTTVKFFPAEAAGGLKMIEALSAPYYNVRFMPTGGITPENLPRYLANPSIVACGGSWMVKEALIDAGDFERIEALTREAVTLTRKHV